MTLGVLVLALRRRVLVGPRLPLGSQSYEEVPGQLYRIARLKPDELDDLIRREGLRSVVVFTGGGDRHPWFVGQREVCQARHVELHAVNLREGQPPSRALLIRLMDVLERCPRPVLVQGYRGTDQVGFAAAIVQLLDGSPPRWRSVSSA